VGVIDVITGTAPRVLPPVLVGVRVTVVVPPPRQAISVKVDTNNAVITRNVLNLGLEFLCIEITF